MVARRNLGGRVPGMGRIVSAQEGARAAYEASQRAANAVEGAAELKRQENIDPDLRNKLEMAFGGQDDLLMPYQPTPSINPPRPRTLAAGYDRGSKSLYVRFREGAMYRYDDVSPREWAAFRRVNSPGRYINRVLNSKDYHRLQ